MADLTIEECNHLIGFWKVCYYCETTIKEGKIGYMKDCHCLNHYLDCGAPRVRETHSARCCSIQLKRKVIDNFVKKNFSTDDVRRVYKRYLKRKYSGLLKESNMTDLTEEECNVLMMCWRICHCCETEVNGTKIQLNTINGLLYGCQCLHHLDCPVPRVRERHLHSCSLQLKQEIVKTYVQQKWNTDDVRRAFRRYMREKLPLLVVRVPETIFYSKLKIIRSLGFGAQGVVDLALSEDHNLPHQMAVKSFKPEAYSERELKNSIKVCDHPNFIQILGVLYQSPAEKENNSSPIGYVMEYMAGGSVHDVVHNFSVATSFNYDLSHVLNWTRQAASALEYLHRKRIIHRDVKPHNMLLSEDRRVLKLCDLGVSNTIQTLETALMGTISYMAPEVMSYKEKVPYTEKCDVYSLAMSVWEMHHRKTPFGDQNINNLFGFVKKVQKGKRPEMAQNCDPRLRRMIERGWSPKVSKRPSMEEIHSFAVKELKKLQNQM